MKKMANSSEMLNSSICRIMQAASATPIVASTVVFLVKAIKVLPSGAMAPRKACGKTMVVMVGRKLSPIARAASACPCGTVLMPLRIASATKAAW